MAALGNISDEVKVAKPWDALTLGGTTPPTPTPQVGQLFPYTAPTPAS